VQGSYLTEGNIPRQNPQLSNLVILPSRPIIRGGLWPALIYLTCPVFLFNSSRKKVMKLLAEELRWTKSLRRPARTSRL